MESYQMGRSCGRPYNHTCGMTRPQPANRENQNRRGNCMSSGNQERACNCVMPGKKERNEEMFSHLQHLEPAMAYVPCQKFTELFSLPYALSVGTVFPQLCKPFCGKRGGCR